MTYEEYNKKRYEIEREYLSKECALYGTLPRAEEDAALDAVRKERNTKLDNLMKEYWEGVNVGDGVTYCLYSDCYPYTVIARTKSTITLQEDKAYPAPGYDYWNNQKYTYKRNPNGEVMKLHWRKLYGFADNGGRLAVGRMYYRDPGF